jgi:type II secretory pathway pseudopilin PulG
MSSAFRSSFSVRRSAFSFIEIMFAVIILGIGFIMVAALFPVAIQQTQASSNDVVATAYANELSQSLSSVLSSTDLPPTGQSSAGAVPCYASIGPVQVGNYNGPGSVAIATSTLFATNPFANTTPTPPPYVASPWTAGNKVTGAIISSTNPQYGCVLFYSRDEGNGAANVAPSNSANVIAIVTQNQNSVSTGYLAGYDTGTSATPQKQPATLQGWPINVAIYSNVKGTAVGLATHSLAVIPSGDTTAAATGAFIVIAQDNCSNTPPTPMYGHFNGRIFRLGARRRDLDSRFSNAAVWELQPGYDFIMDAPGTPYYTSQIPDSNPYANAFIVGRQLLNGAYAPGATIPATDAGAPPNPVPNGGATNAFAGNSQAIAAYSFTIPLQ